VLRDRHHLRPEEEDDFNIQNPEDIIQAQLDASKTLTVLLIAIASVSLIVGGIGIMNVMLVSVTESTCSGRRDGGIDSAAIPRRIDRTESGGRVCRGTARNCRVLPCGTDTSLAHRNVP
jgi:hypothetical protein